MLKNLISLAALVLFAFNASASHQNQNFMDSEAYDPNDPNIEQILEAYDDYYYEVTGLEPHEGESLVYPIHHTKRCRRKACPAYIDVNLSTQRAKLYHRGSLVGKYKISSGKKGSSTKTWDGNPNSRVYNAYTSTKWPEGDYNGLGNMPYAMFYYRGFAIHGTTRGNFKRLGRRASHGCVRMHPDHAKKLNRLRRKYGRTKTWFYIHY